MGKICYGKHWKCWLVLNPVHLFWVYYFLYSYHKTIICKKERQKQKQIVHRKRYLWNQIMSSKFYFPNRILQHCFLSWYAQSLLLILNLKMHFFWVRGKRTLLLPQTTVPNTLTSMLFNQLKASNNNNIVFQNLTVSCFVFNFYFFTIFTPNIISDNSTSSWTLRFAT